jgi:predicted outer membrane protein
LISVGPSFDDLIWDQPMASHDDVNKAFQDGNVQELSDERLHELLNALCTVPIHSAPVQTLAQNRALTINTILTKRMTERLEKAATKLGIVGIALTAVGVLVAIIELCTSG